MNPKEVRHYIELIEQELIKYEDATDRDEEIEHHDEIGALADELSDVINF